MNSFIRENSQFLNVMLLVMMCLLSFTPVSASEDEHLHHAHGREQDHEHENQTSHITENMAELNSVESAMVSAGEINKTATLYGTVTLSPEHTSHVSARFAGRIMRVYVEYGDTVEKGDVLASVEANTSLQTYAVTAPLSGIVIAKHANAGEVVSEQTLFTITDTSTLWAELKVFPSQASLIKPQQSVVLQSDDMQTSSQIIQLLPNSSGEPFRIARVKFKNPLNYWFPGLLVKAEVIVEKSNVNVRVPLSALQQYENNTVVFVKNGEEYFAAVVELGIQDDDYAEVLSGLQSGAEIVVSNSYLIKADLEKDGAAHSH